MGVIINLLLFTTILLLVLLDIGECRRSSKKFNTDVFFSYYNCKGKFDHNKIRMLASLCLMCYDGDWGAYRYRYYCSRNCFQTFTYEECLQKLTFSQKDLESIQSDFEFITNNRNFFNGLVNQGVLPNETTDETTENIDHLMVSSTSHRPV
ncbi:uncharacterized protein LOC123272634 isoform X2 [Cotesia glomerata]|uniref:uncharacterized protein LOC123272634 isoform X2 n=1 Tax=Cotesia glomerata TaxID=32391 RepID=UPI001D01478C|nr:uncharacterized protein LOC123272634 isoform X2 [Cotesia glomerata]